MVSLRPVEPSDLPVLYEQQRDPAGIALAGVGGRDHHAFMEHWTVLVAGEVAGHVLSFEHGDRREVGYWLARHHWGRGVATAALVAFLGEEQTRPLHAGVLPANGGSLRVLEKCGFAVCGEEDGLVILRLD